QPDRILGREIHRLEGHPGPRRRWRVRIHSAHDQPARFDGPSGPRVAGKPQQVVGRDRGRDPPPSRCRARRRAGAMKRFYKDTAVEVGEAGHAVLLDGKPIRTPAKALLVLPTAALAEAVAAEWRDVPENAEIKPAHLPMTRLATTGTDRVATQREKVI